MMQSLWPVCFSLFIHVLVDLMRATFGGRLRFRAPTCVNSVKISLFFMLQDVRTALNRLDSFYLVVTL